MVSFNVRADSLSEVAALIGNVITTFDTNLSSVNSTVQSTVNVGWVGEDAESFSEGWTTFNAQAAIVRQALADLQAKLIAADNSYTTNESGVRTSFADQHGDFSAMSRATSGFNRRVDIGEGRAEDMAAYFGRNYQGDTGGQGGGASFGVAGRRASGGANNGTGPADTNETDDNSPFLNGADGPDLDNPYFAEGNDPDVDSMNPGEMQTLEDQATIDTDGFSEFNNAGAENG
ncbi:WXG100 family type VII secretion target [Humidisolicoccus flavus]|uniref:WXG100 family type VII secretion target n=1 Tax=Humidisolicoccus flavus TaxID=3111414 RepID=UPI00324743D2